MTSVTYFKDLQDRLGHHHKEDPSTYTLEELVTLGKALNAEMKIIGRNGDHRLKQKVLLQEIEALQTDGSFEADKEQAELLDSKADRIGYSLVHVGTNTKEQARHLREEMWVFYHELLKISEKHDGELKDKWAEFAHNVRVVIHSWNNETDTIGLWLHHLRKEFEKRQPGYVEKTLDEEMEEDAMSNDEFEMLFAQDDPDEPIYTDHEIEVMELENQLHDYQQRVEMFSSLYDRLQRITLSNEATTAEQRVEIEKLNQSARDITSDKYVNKSDWRLTDKENIRLLTEIAKPEGHSFPVHYRGNHHFMRNLILRYGINITNRDRMTFNCTRLAWANNYWGTIKDYEDRGEIIISLWVGKQNKGEGGVPDFESDDAWDYFFETKTTLVAKQHGDRFLELERKYAPLSADHRRYSNEDLMKAHKLIMGDLLKD